MTTVNSRRGPTRSRSGDLRGASRRSAPKSLARLGTSRVTSDTGPEITGVLETALYYTDEAATADFYKNVMRMHPIGKRPGYFLFYRAGRSVFLLFNPEA